MDWSKKEIAYQHVHMFWGFWISYIMYYITGSIAMVCCGAWVGLAVEFYQYYYSDYKMLYLDDRFRDWIFWMIGGLLILFVK